MENISTNKNDKISSENNVDDEDGNKSDNGSENVSDDDDDGGEVDNNLPSTLQELHLETDNLTSSGDVDSKNNGSSSLVIEDVNQQDSEEEEIEYPDTNIELQHVSGDT